AKKIRHSEGLLSAEEGKRVKDLLAIDAEVLVRGIVLCLDELSRGELLPADVYLCGGGSLLPEVMLELSKPAWHRGLQFVNTPRVRLLAPEDVAHVKDS